MRTTRKIGASGFTLVEMVVVLALVVLVTSLAYTFWGGAAQTEAGAREKDDTRLEATRLLAFLKRDLRSAARFSATSTAVDFLVNRVDESGTLRLAAVSYRHQDSTWIRVGVDGECTRYCFPAAHARGSHVSVAVRIVSEALASCSVMVMNEAGVASLQLEERVEFVLDERDE